MHDPHGSHEHAAVLAAEHRRHQALLADDLAALAEVLADDLSITHTRGLTQNKAELLDYIRNEMRFTAVERASTQVRLYGDVAVMTGEVTNVAVGRKRGDIVEVRSQTLQVWHRSAAGWKMVALQATALPPPRA